MKLIRYFYFIFLLTAFSFAYSTPPKSALSREERLFLSKLDEEFLEESDPEGWILFIKELKGDKLAVEFPCQPALSLYEKRGKGDEVFEFSASEDEIIYTLRVETKPQRRDEVERTIDLVKDAVSPFYQLLQRAGKEGPYGLCIDLEYLDVKPGTQEKKKFKQHFIVNSERLYILKAESSVVGLDKYSDFISSFHIIKPLK